MNQFDYFSEIEETFISRRGKALFLSPIDWALIEVWKERGIPLRVALRGIEKTFDSWESKPRHRTIKSLLYCREEVEAQYAEWLQSRVGANESTPSSKPPEDEGLPFAKQSIIQHLQRCRSQLVQSLERVATYEFPGDARDTLITVLNGVASRLLDLERELTEAARPDAQQLEISLTGLEKVLSDAIEESMSDGAITTAESEVQEQLRPYRRQMDAAVYEQTANNLLMKRLRERFGVPRLSLFYI